MNCLKKVGLKQIGKIFSDKIDNSLLLPQPPCLYFKRNYPEFRKRFFKNVSVAGSSRAYEINLDHRKLKTPYGNVLKVPNYPLALAVANEWTSVEDKIISPWMHLTGLSYTVVDNPQKLTKETIINKMTGYLENDTLLYRDETTEDFIKLQAKEWDPILEWFNTRFQTDLKSSKNVTPQEISADTLTKITKYLSVYNIWACSGLIFGIEALRSVILSLATMERKITPERAVQLTLLETEYQTSYWGNVIWAHECDKYDMLARFSASILFAQLNSSEYVKKQKGIEI